MFDTFNNRVVLRATLEMQTALSVGSRISLEPVGTDLPVIKGPDGLPFIPGSSIKGAVRVLTERILRTLNNREAHLWACDPFATPCVPEKRRDEHVGKDELWSQSLEKERHGEGAADEIFARLIWNHSCSACRIFGSPWLASRVSFKDAYLENPEDLPVVTQIRDGVGIDRDLSAARQGFKYDFEVVVPGARLGIEILTENLDDWELGLLLSVLRFWEEGQLPLGGKVTRGPGWGKLKDLCLERIDHTNLVNYLTGGQPAQDSPEKYLQAFRDYLSQHLNQGEG